MKMMYYVSILAQSNGDHEVHIAGCVWLPKTEYRKYLGEFETCQEAIREAKGYYNNADGCKYCSRPCHSR